MLHSSFFYDEICRIPVVINFVLRGSHARTVNLDDLHTQLCVLIHVYTSRQGILWILVSKQSQIVYVTQLIIRGGEEGWNSCIPIESQVSSCCKASNKDHNITVTK